MKYKDIKHWQCELLKKRFPSAFIDRFDGIVSIHLEKSIPAYQVRYLDVRNQNQEKKFIHNKII